MLYILTLLIILFTKEIIVINPEFVVIIGFITIFFLLKSLTQNILVESLASYADEIRKTYLTAVYADLKNAEKELENNSMAIQTEVNIKEYYNYILAIIVLFLEKAKYANIFSTIEGLNLSLKHIVTNIQQIKRKTFSINMEKSKKNK